MTRACSAILLLAALALACRPDRGGSAESGVMSITHAVVPALGIPPGGPVRLAPGSFHAMRAGLTRPLVAGDTVTLELHFARAGPIAVRAPVLRYTEAVEEASPPHH
jgi:copper(I)-binding protein